MKTVQRINTNIKSHDRATPKLSAGFVNSQFLAIGNSSIDQKDRQHSSNYLRSYKNESSKKTLNVTDNSKNNSYQNNESIQMSSSNSNAFSDDSEQMEDIDSKSQVNIENSSSLEQEIINYI